MRDTPEDSFSIDTDQAGREMPGMPWFKFYAEFATDPKVQAMAEPLQRRFVMLLCLQCSGDLDKLDDEELARALRITPKELEKTREVFRRKGFVGETWTPRNWEKRQASRDRTAAERMRRLRERQREQERNPDRNVARNSDDRLRVDLDVDTEDPPLIPPSGGEVSGPLRAGRKSGRRKKTRQPPPEFTPPEWVPAKEWVAFVEMRQEIKKPLTLKAMELAVDKLAAYKEAGKDVTEILRNAVIGSWQGIYADKDDRNRAARQSEQAPLVFHKKGKPLP